MAKRFTDSEKWKDDWYLSLTNDYKIVWQYLLDNCSIAGIIKISLKHLNFCCDTKLTLIDIEKIFKGRVYNLGEFYFIPKFISFQYPAGLTSEKPAIISIRKELNKYNLLTDENTLVNIDNLIIKESLTNDCQIIKDKDKDKVTDKVKDKDKVKGENIFKKFPPSLQDVSLRIQQRGLKVDAENFIAYYESNGWKVGKNPMKNWDSALTTWNKNNFGNQNNSNGTTRFKSNVPPRVGDNEDRERNESFLAKLIGQDEIHSAGEGTDRISVN